MDIQMKEKSTETEYAGIFICVTIVCSMLLVFPFRIGGMEILSAVLFLLCIGWMLTNIIQTNRGSRKSGRKYIRLDMVVLLLLVYELGILISDLFREIAEDEPEPDYSGNLLLIDLVLLYLLVMETKQLKIQYLDLILYCGLPVMAIMLIGYLVEPQLGEVLDMWGDQAATASYLLLVSAAGIIQFCRCEEEMKRCFYGMCAGISFFLLGCNHSVVSFWILTVTILMIPIVIRPTAKVWKRTMQMLFLFLILISSMSLLTHYTKLFLVPVDYGLEHSVCLGMLSAVGGMVFFYCWDRIPEGTDQGHVVMQGLYRLDQLCLRGIMAVWLLFLSGGSVWSTGGQETFAFSIARSFARPLIEEIEINQSVFYQCLAARKVMPVLLCILALTLYTERIHKALSWKQAEREYLCLAAVSLCLQLFVWEISWNILPVAVIFMTWIIV